MLSSVNRTGAQLMYMSDEAVKRMSEVHYPYIIQHGDVDKLTNVEGSKLMQEKAASNDKTLTVSKLTLEGVTYQ